MPSLDVAHVNEQGQNMLLFALDDSFGQKSDGERSAVLAELQRRANAAGLAGRAAVFWRHAGHEHFLGPQPWHLFLQGLSVDTVVQSANKTIRW